MTVSEFLQAANFEGRVLIRDKDGAVCGGLPTKVIRQIGDREVLSSFVGFEGALVLKIR